MPETNDKDDKRHGHGGSGEDTSSTETNDEMGEYGEFLKQIYPTLLKLLNDRNMSSLLIDFKEKTIEFKRRKKNRN